MQRVRHRGVRAALTAAVAVAAMAVAPAATLGSNPCTHTAVSSWAASDQGTRTITPPGGSASSIYAKFSATWKKDTFDPINICYSVAGTSRAAWTGTKPYNASSVRLSDQWHFDGVGISLGFPASAGFTASGTTIAWSTTHNSTWFVNHDFVDIWFKSIIPTGQWEQSTGYFTFGSSSYNVVAYDHS